MITVISSSNGRLKMKGRIEEYKEELRQLCTKQVKILTRTCHKEFLELLTARVSAWSFPKSQVELGTVLVSINSFCGAVLDKLPYLGKDLLPTLICTGIGVLASSFHLLEGFTGLQQKIKEINDTFETEKEVVKKGGFSEAFELYLHSKEPPQDYRRVQIVPTLKELLEDKRPFLRPNKIKGAYDSPEHYLDVQFRLLREDFVQPLRKGVEHFLENKGEYLKTTGKKKFKNQQQDASVRIYTRVEFNRVEKSRDNGNVYFFNLPQEMVKKVNWAKSKKLLPGCLVMLTSDCCETAIFATTLAPPFDQVSSSRSSKGIDPRRQELSFGILRVSIETGEEHVEKNLDYIMFECEAYFEAYRYNLDILQKTRMLRDDSTMGKFIVEASCSINVPLYAGWRRRNENTPPQLKLPFPWPVYGPLKEGELEFWEFGKAVKVPITQDEDQWPDSLVKVQLGLDENQYKAYKTALTSELSIIQGPPGTGKTFIGLQIVKTLLLNKSKVGRRDAAIPDSPILILCYTNHALDQFLELLLREIEDLNLIRVGGQCKSDILKGHSLHEKRVSMGMDSKWAKRLHWQTKMVEKELSTLRYEIRKLEQPAGIFDCEKLTLWKKALGRFPCSLRSALSTGDWLGVPVDIRKSIKVQLKEMIVKCIEKAGPKKQGKVEDDMVEVKEIQGKPKGKACEEDYDMDELLEHRLADAYYENLMPAPETINYGVYYHYLPNCSATGCREQALDIERSMVNTTTNRRLKDLQLDMKENQNRAKILSGIFDLWEYKQLPLPNVELLLSSRKVARTRARPEWAKLIRQRVNDEYGRRFRSYGRGSDDDYFVETVTEFEFVRQLKSIFSLKMDARWGLYFKVVEIALKLGRDEGWLPFEKSGCDWDDDDGAAKNHSLLETASPRIVVIEEAAEILEAHIVTSLTEDCHQLILIGDHLQLRPSTNVYQLEQKYHMNVSLFERMILNNINLCTLQTQHRMCPEVVDLIVGPIYKQLDNHPKSSSIGVTKNLFFLTHSHLEDTDAELLSKSNYFEADLISGLCEYLLNQGYKPSQITILTTYTGQMFLLKKVISDACVGVRITCVDNYQGEENDIILLSLVRSNKEDKIGFVGIDNRICVALSEPNTMYIVGNLDSLMRAHRWKCGESLELSCTQHGNKTRVSERSHFAPLKLGGCGLNCELILECAHRCPLPCHGKDHSNTLVNKRSTNVLPNVGRSALHAKHLFLKTSLVDTSWRLRVLWIPLTYKCSFIVTKELPCELKHEKDLPCHKDVSLIKCEVPVEKTLKPCGHIQTVQCHQPIDEVACDFEIEHTFPVCNHVRRIYCFQKSKASCVDNCESILTCGHECTLHVMSILIQIKDCTRSCSFGHPCSTKHRCYEKCRLCQTLTKKQLDCGHEDEVPCHKHPPNTPVCCGDPKVLTCGHEQLVKCGMKPEDYKCKAKCEKLCSSGHPCGVEHACHEPCPDCQTQVVKSLPCPQPQGNSSLS
ncbi:NFX1-type zinc finger-containing protein 1 [Orchesella cincta]|uniref:NFX1-type zinc finger-containing protein 1 n=1 Tax=Orchesella cincta TaxID=48709 RepID=A0A1D2M6R6_ORCCI|nr:NFX1-type zinc finger-containing protein 1 [Orchesella cincta]